MPKPIRIFPVLALALAGAVMAASPAFAVPITYTEQATATIHLGGVVFTNASIVLTMRNDTANVTPGQSPFSFINTGTATVSVNGSLAVTFSNPISVIVDHNNPGAAFFDFVRGGDILFVSNTLFAAYGLTTSIGPIFGRSFLNLFVDYPTSAGPFIVFSILNNTATFTATTASAVPEPPSLPALAAALGLLALVLRTLRRRARVAPDHPAAV